MKRAFLLVAAVLTLVGATSVATARTNATAMVSITSTGFNPDTIAINQGDTVTWKNNDSADHQVVSDTNTFKSPVLKPGQSYSYRFATSATDSYYDAKKPSSQGLVTVRGDSSSVTVGLSDQFVIYGTSVHVAGAVGNGRAGESVSILIQPFGLPQTTKVVKTDADGVFDFAYKPLIRTDFAVTWKGVQSDQQPTVNVRPKVVFRVLSAKQSRYSVKVSALRSYAGKTVKIQRLSSKGQWVTTKKVKLNQRSQATFTGNLPRGKTHARAWVGAAPGYINGFSVTKIITR